MELRPPAIRCSLQDPARTAPFRFGDLPSNPIQSQPAQQLYSSTASQPLQAKLLRSKESARRNRSHIADRGVPATPLHKIEE
ncbi:hypothetical protein M5D96_009828 [Drosophila gunungcola]|uniref:Uncharacterized protein n=1 Tax=Drosophila gunungcola TaxID=103775 RepID=A0A9Q0BLP1_9MUSC|nr:hypothetical protein M5D96_009828 [Drosophila gunungcola]